MHSTQAVEQLTLLQLCEGTWKYTYPVWKMPIICVSTFSVGGTTLGCSHILGVQYEGVETTTLLFAGDLLAPSKVHL